MGFWSYGVYIFSQMFSALIIIIIIIRFVKRQNVKRLPWRCSDETIHWLRKPFRDASVVRTSSIGLSPWCARTSRDVAGTKSSMFL